MPLLSEKEIEDAKRGFYTASQRGIANVLFEAHPDVSYPGYDQNQDLHILNFCHQKGRRDWVVTEAGVSETQSFKGRWVKVFVPWAAVQRITILGNPAYEDGNFTFRSDFFDAMERRVASRKVEHPDEDDIDAEADAEVEARADLKATRGGSEGDGKPRGFLRLVPKEG
jgi:hypothetical protein